jgi:hypothetical protein
LNQTELSFDVIDQEKNKNQSKIKLSLANHCNGNTSAMYISKELEARGNVFLTVLGFELRASGLLGR